MGYRLGCFFFYTENRLINVVDTSIFTGVGDGGFDLPDQLGGGCLSHEFSGDVDGGEGGVYDAASEMLSKPAMVISSGIL